jgi:LuxR family maltose regulon positive regulatory protein
MESQIILPTKLFVPQLRTEMVPRHSLLKQINDHFSFTTILVAAPAGFGKTTLICNWIQQVEIPVAWFSIGEGDNDPVVFLSYVISALRTIDSRIGESAFTMAQSPQPDFEMVLTSLIKNVLQHGEDMVLVLEDYHFIKEKQILKLTDFLIDHKAGNLHLVIISRSDPLLPLHRYRTKNQLTEIRAVDLSFSDEEAYAFFNKVMGIGLSLDHAVNLNHRTEGWITGLQMAALTMKSQADHEGFVRSFTGDNRYVMDYLIEEVIIVQSDRVKSFLLETSILERFTWQLCEAVTGIENCEDIIDLLERENLFLISLDSRKTWYRYHHLFASLLKKRLLDRQPESIPDLHKKASQWFTEHDHLPEAIDHSLKAKDWQNAALLVERTFMDRMNRGEDFAVMLDRLEALPDEMICSRPSLCIMYAWMLSLTLQLDEAEGYLQFVEEKEAGKLGADLQMQIALIRADNARHRGDVRFSIQRLRWALDEIAGNPTDSIAQVQNYTSCIMNLAWSYLIAGEADLAVEQFQRAVALSEEIGSITLVLLHIKGLAQSLRLRGRIASAGDKLEEALVRIKESTFYGQLTTAAAFVYLEYGNYLREVNNLSEAERYIRSGLDLGIKRRIDGTSLRDGYCNLARVQFARNDAAASKSTFREADRQLSKFYSIQGFSLPLENWKYGLLLASVSQQDRKAGNEDRREMEKWISSQDISVDPDVSTIEEEVGYLLWARWFIYREQPAKALQLLDHLHDHANQKARGERIITILILQALALEASQFRNRALVRLSHAVDLAEPEGYVRIFLDEGDVVARLLKQLRSENITDESGKMVKVPLPYIEKLLLSFEAENVQRPVNGLSEQLSKREREVLLMLAAGLTNQAIGEKLFISKDTVKSHLKNIYVKLNTGNRRQAVERARELGLL